MKSLKPLKTWTLKNLDPKKTWTLKKVYPKKLDPEKRGKQLDVEKSLEDHII